MENKFIVIEQFMNDMVEGDMNWMKEMDKLVEQYGMQKFRYSQYFTSTVQKAIRMNEESRRFFFLQEAKQRTEKFVADIESKIGEIIGVQLCRIGADRFEGIAIGEQGTLRIATFIAGGYNIQRMHFRTKMTLVK